MSLRRSLILAFSVLLTLLASASAFYAHHAAKREVWGILDLQLRQLARFIGDGSGVGAGGTGLPPGEDDEDLVVEIRYGDGRPALVSRGGVAFPAAIQPGFSLFRSAGAEWRLFTLVDGWRTVRVAQQTTEREELAADAAWGSALPFLLMIPLSWLTVSVLVGFIMRRLEGLAADVGNIRPEEAAAISVARAPLEVRPLVMAFNKAVARLGTALGQQRSFVSDAAHGLRTPLTALGLQLENIAAANRDPALSGPIADLSEVIRRASRLSRQLLQLAGEEAMQGPPQPDEADLGTAALEALASLIPLAESRGIDLGAAEMMPLRVRAAQNAVVSVLEILLDNAVRYAPPGGTVDVSVTLHHGNPTILIADNGPGIAEDMLDRVFDRFYRAGRTDGDGSGLGLAIARAVARRLGADLSIRNRQGAHGIEARLAFPVAAAVSFPGS